MATVEMKGRSKKKPQKLAMEDYIDFVESQRRLDLPIHHLNEIIDMHGFRRPQKANKKVLIDVVGALDLLDPFRSTLEDDGVSSCAFITLEEVIVDLNILNWQECCVTSLQTINAVNFQEVKDPTAAVSVSASRTRKQPTKKLNYLHEINNSNSILDAGSAPCSNSADQVDKLPARKKKKRMKNPAAGGALASGNSTTG